jgi:hypothetical protein
MWVHTSPVSHPYVDLRQTDQCSQRPLKVLVYCLCGVLEAI